MNHSLTRQIVKLIYSLSELVIIMGRYLGIYAKDSLDELLLISHRGSSYKGNGGDAATRESATETAPAVAKPGGREADGYCD